MSLNTSVYMLIKIIDYWLVRIGLNKSKAILFLKIIEWNYYM